MRKDKEKDTVNVIGLMVQSTEADGKMGFDMDMDNLIHKVKYMQVSG